MTAGTGSLTATSAAIDPARDARLTGTTWRLTLAAGVLQLVAQTIVLGTHAPGWAAPLLAGAGVVVGLAVLVPRALRVLRRRRELWLAVAAGVLAVGWIAAAADRLSAPLLPFSPGIGTTQLFYGYSIAGVGGWPWRLGSMSVPAFAGALLTCMLALVLISDAVRVRLGFLPHQPVPWRQLTSVAERPVDVSSRVVVALLLLALAAALAIPTADTLAAGDPARQSFALAAILAVVAMVIGVPVLVGMRMRLHREHVVGERDRERQRLAAHLHDSVLQTLALVQRQAHDPGAVVRLARRQEHALRAWMAGESELLSETLVASLRDAAATVEDEHELTIEFTAIGDRPLDRGGEALVAAAREALRNAARHAPAAPVFMFAEVWPGGAEVFVRDEGPGFELATVAVERRGVRDAIIGRMEAAGGRAVVESAPGEGTEVALRIGAPGAGR